MLVLPKIFTCNRHHDYNKITQGTLIVANWNSAVFVLPLEQRKQMLTNGCSVGQLHTVRLALLNVEEIASSFTTSVDASTSMNINSEKTTQISLAKERQC
ncbi:capsid protein [Trichinella pseudospiralis]